VLDTKTYWLTDRQSQYDFDFDFEDSLEIAAIGDSWMDSPTYIAGEQLRYGIV
jgi:hypothetical protein